MILTGRHRAPRQRCDQSSRLLVTRGALRPLPHASSEFTQQSTEPGQLVVDPGSSERVPKYRLLRCHDIDAQLILNLINGMNGRPVGAARVNCIRFGVISLELPREQDRKLARDFAEVLDRIPAGHYASWFESQVAHRPVMIGILLRPEWMNRRHLAGTKGLERADWVDVTTLVPISCPSWIQIVSRFSIHSDWSIGFPPSTTMSAPARAMAFAASRLLAWLSLICSAVDRKLSDVTAS